MKSVLKVTIAVALTFTLYGLIFGVVIFNFYQQTTTDTYSAGDFFHEQQSTDRVVLLEDNYEALIARISFIEKAEETLDITSHTIHRGFSTEIIFGSIIEAADRGVQVRVLLDGMFHNLRGPMRDVQYAFYNHPNIELKFYEPFSLLQPWTWNNRLHDKIMIRDDNMAMIGGRNIGDKYFTTDDDTVHDRDVVIINQQLNTSPDSVLHQLNDYFSLVWQHEFSKSPIEQLNRAQLSRGDKKTTALKDNLVEMKQSHPELFINSFNWHEKSIPTNKITLLHNGIQRFNKEPNVWANITNLLEDAEKSILVQSPYVIPTKEMLAYVDKQAVSAPEITISTNSLSATPNVLAFSGYLNNRKMLVDSGINIYEYQGPRSIHGKTLVIDNRINVIGSFNIDHRSSFLSTETMVVIDSEELATQLEKEIKKHHLCNSLLVKEVYSYEDSDHVDAGEVSLLKKVVTHLLSKVTRFFDFML
ncbi:hypothetical protein BKP35_10680 [Anaerobacillus arseniciselenatis]|uniref:PLD phosphodiesterase domain-containing protein n=1 Tax=Anaerobacillus arseniciselenatis TaxID=85682 RepID=A0A1S2LJH5_9BACI|nr:phospholipase D family protein [Anaerobacillus arseniciselenatis]OIJ12263.1 hypothetical protein BKP35_10680 [Anaerobacillus arseniciselenatis]